jgi:hypothetical protein
MAIFPSFKTNDDSSQEEGKAIALPEVAPFLQLTGVKQGLKF